MSSAEEQDVQRLMGIANATAWMRPVAGLGATVTSFWLIYLVYSASAAGPAAGMFMLMSFVYWFGPSPMFAVAASILCFHFEAVGLWLPVVSYVMAAVLLYVDLGVDRLTRG